MKKPASERLRELVLRRVERGVPEPLSSDERVVAASEIDSALQSHVGHKDVLNRAKESVMRAKKTRATPTPSLLMSNDPPRRTPAPESAVSPSAPTVLPVFTPLNSVPRAPKQADGWAQLAKLAVKEEIDDKARTALLKREKQKAQREFLNSQVTILAAKKASMRQEQQEERKRIEELTHMWESENQKAAEKQKEVVGYVHTVREEQVHELEARKAKEREQKAATDSMILKRIAEEEELAKQRQAMERERMIQRKQELIDSNEELKRIHDQQKAHEAELDRLDAIHLNERLDKQERMRNAAWERVKQRMARRIEMELQRQATVTEKAAEDEQKALMVQKAREERLLAAEQEVAAKKVAAHKRILEYQSKQVEELHARRKAERAKLAQDRIECEKVIEEAREATRRERIARRAREVAYIEEIKDQIVANASRFTPTMTQDELDLNRRTLSRVETIE